MDNANAGPTTAGASGDGPINQGTVSEWTNGHGGSSTGGGSRWRVNLSGDTK